MPLATPMDHPDVQLQSAVIVLVGDFNPKIYQPAWLAQEELISKEMAEAADVQIIAKQICAYTVEWFTIEVTTERFQASTADPGHFPLLRDLVIGVFGQLKHTPCRALGINRQLHAKMSDRQIWHQVGDVLAPKAIWNKVLSHESTKLDRPSTGLLSLSIMGNRPGSSAACLRVVVEPSDKISNGVYLRTNEHYDIESASVVDAMQIIAQEWVEAVRFAEALVGQVIAEATK